MEAHGGDVLAYAVIVNDRVGIVGVQIVHADMLITLKGKATFYP